MVFEKAVTSLLLISTSISIALKDFVARKNPKKSNRFRVRSEIMGGISPRCVLWSQWRSQSLRMISETVTSGNNWKHVRRTCRTKAYGSNLLHCTDKFLIWFPRFSFHMRWQCLCS